MSDVHPFAGSGWFCQRCGSETWRGDLYCSGCRRELAAARRERRDDHAD